MSNIKINKNPIIFSLVLVLGVGWTALAMETKSPESFPYYTLVNQDADAKVETEFEFIPERFYEKATANRHLIVGPLSPCAAVIITNHDIELTSSQQFNTLIFHVHCTNCLEFLVNKATNELGINQQSKNISITIFSKELKGDIYDEIFLQLCRNKSHEEVFNELDEYLRSSFPSSANFRSTFLQENNNNYSAWRDQDREMKDKFLLVSAEGKIYFINPIKEGIFNNNYQVMRGMEENKAYCALNFYRQCLTAKPPLLTWKEYQEKKELLEPEINESIYLMDSLCSNSYRECPCINYIPGASFTRKKKSNSRAQARFY